MQELKDKLTELLKENPEAPEAPTWKHMLTEMGKSVLVPQLADTRMVFRKHPVVSFASRWCLNVSESVFCIFKIVTFKRIVLRIGIQLSL